MPAKDCFGFNYKEICSAHKRGARKSVIPNSGPEQKKEVVTVKESTFKCNICNISCTGEDNFPRVMSCPNMLELKTYLIPHVLSYHF